MAILKNERAGDILGVHGRFHNVVTWPQSGEIANQTWTSDARQWMEHGDTYRATVTICHDDNCKNGRPTFAVTMDGRVRRAGRTIGEFGGAAHDVIAERFPELAPLLIWHLCSTDGPMHYVANTVYLAGDRDCWGLKAGDPSSWKDAVQFGANPIKHELSQAFATFLRTYREGIDGQFDFEVLPLYHTDSGKSHKHQFAPKYTFGGYGERWHEAPFDTEEAALDFLCALQTCEPRFVRVVTARSEGKTRELDAARRAAVWPDATDADLMQEPEALKTALAKRLPGLITNFRRDVEAIGFIWSAVDK